jgi:nucleoside-diphosphate-sugar epimerase
MTEKYLVTGAAGFIGAAVTKKLCDQSQKVTAVASPTSDPWRLNRNKQAKIVKLDLTNKDQVARLINTEKPDRIIHLASHGVYPHQQKDTEAIIAGNYLMTYYLLEAIRSQIPKGFVNAGSVFEYGTQKGQVRENEAAVSDILNNYSASKIATTALCSAYAQIEKLPIITLRLFTVYGPREDPSRFFTANILRSLINEPIKIPSCPVIRDFVYIDDVVMAILLAVKSPSPGIINVGSGQKTSLEDAAKLITKLTKSDAEVKLDEKYNRPCESACWANISQAKRLLGWQPQTKLTDGIKATIDWVAKTWYKQTP